VISGRGRFRVRQIRGCTRMLLSIPSDYGTGLSRQSRRGKMTGALFQRSRSDQETNRSALKSITCSVDRLRLSFSNDTASNFRRLVLTSKSQRSMKLYQCCQCDRKASFRLRFLWEATVNTVMSTKQLPYKIEINSSKWNHRTGSKFLLLICALARIAISEMMKGKQPMTCGQDRW